MLRLGLLVAGAAAVLGVGAPVASADIGWCGSGEAAANRLPDAVAGRLVHVVYAYPSDGADGFAAAASPIASVVAKVDSWWQGQDPTRTPRFDLYAFPGCAGFGSLDLSVIELPLTAAQLQPSDGRFALLDHAIPSFGPGVKPVVYYDGPLDSPDLCGTAAGDPESSAGSLAVLYLRSTCMTSVAAGAAVFAHELTHELGSPTPFSPHACPGDTGHVCDSNHDLMYPYLSFDSIDDLVLDVGRDDYYRHGQAWADVSQSAWLRHLDTPQQPLALAISGGGTVTSDLPGVVCTASCTTLWDQGSTVVLETAAAAGRRFVGWKGGCSGSSCAVTLNAPAAVEAVFGPASITMSVRVSGGGKVVGAGVSCPKRCAASVPTGDLLTLRATATKGWRLASWSGACRGTKPTCRVTPQVAVSVAARFTR